MINLVGFHSFSDYNLPASPKKKQSLATLSSAIAYTEPCHGPLKVPHVCRIIIGPTNSDGGEMRGGGGGGGGMDKMPGGGGRGTSGTGSGGGGKDSTLCCPKCGNPCTHVETFVCKRCGLT